MVDCALEQYGCKGGYLIPAIEFLVSEGTVKEECKPYKTEKKHCTKTCENGEEYKKYYCKPGSFKILTTRDDIQKEIYDNGPVIVSLSLMSDFNIY